MGKGSKQNTKRRREKTVGAEKAERKEIQKHGENVQCRGQGFSVAVLREELVLQRGTPVIGTPLLASPELLVLISVLPFQLQAHWPPETSSVSFSDFC